MFGILNAIAPQPLRFKQRTLGVFLFTAIKKGGKNTALTFFLCSVFLMYETNYINR